MTADGGISGALGGKKITASGWQWQGTQFRRALKTADKDFPSARQNVTIDGDMGKAENPRCKTAAQAGRNLTSRQFHSSFKRLTPFSRVQPPRGAGLRRYSPDTPPHPSARPAPTGRSASS